MESNISKEEKLQNLKALTKRLLTSINENNNTNEIEVSVDLRLLESSNEVNHHRFLYQSESSVALDGHQQKERIDESHDREDSWF